MHWIMMTRYLDPTDDQLGFVTRWIETLAARLDRLDVICQEQQGYAPPGNVRVYSMGKESGAGRVAQAMRLTAHLRALVPQADGVFCHMIPRYVLFAAPWARLHHKPLLFWYTHRQASRELRLAHPLPVRILTAAPGSYPLPTDRLVVTGHGVETALFAPADHEASPPEIVMVGRLAHIKRQDWLIRAAALLHQRAGIGPFKVRIVGGPVPAEPDYPARLAALAGNLPVVFDGPQPHASTAAIVGRCAVSVNLSPPGLFDKTALESMIAGRPTLVTNPDFLPVLGDTADLLTLPDSATDEELAGRLARLLALTPAERAALGQPLRDRALAAHSLDALMDRVVALMREVTPHA